MITKEIAVKLGYRAELLHVEARNADGTPARCRVNGKCKVWIRSPDRFRLPVKYGLKECFYITPGNAGDWYPAEMVQFFFANAGYSYDPKTETAEQGRWRCAFTLAAAEQWLYAQEPTVQWGEDLGEAGPLYMCTVTDEQGRTASLCGIDLGPNPIQSDPYARTVVAELALEMMN